MALSLTATPYILLCAEPASRLSLPAGMMKNRGSIKNDNKPQGRGWFLRCHKSLTFNLCLFFLPELLGTLDVTQKIPRLIAQHSEAPASHCSTDGVSCLLGAGHPMGCLTARCHCTVCPSHCLTALYSRKKKHRGGNKILSFSFLTLTVPNPLGENNLLPFSTPC